jgi:thiol-disulfide isomerase/thioredoxin
VNRRDALLGAAGGLLAAAALASPGPARAAGADSLEPLLRSGQTWLNGRPSAAELAKRVVVVDVFTFGCENCRNVTPNLRSLSTRRSADVAILGIHTPETNYERDPANVVVALRRLGVRWPVVLDPESILWNAYGVSAWPTQFVFDRHGRLKATVVGDSQDATLDAAIDRYSPIARNSNAANSV